MVLLKTKKELSEYLNTLGENEKLGLVPTMGALHQGHMSLVSKAISENEYVIVSVFVNPTQFNNQEDLEKYPKTLKADMTLLSSISGQTAVFVPSVKEIYEKSAVPNTYDFDGLDTVMEGEFRDDHFNGVGTIVELLLRIVKPDNAYFGEKDFQQLQIIRKMVQLQNISTTIVGCPIVREKSGLAMSSRNERLPKKIRKKAAIIYKVLLSAKTKFGMKSAVFVREWVQQEFKKHTDFKLEYFEIAAIDTLTPILEKQKNVKYRAFIAVYANEVRLIDNIALN